MILKGKQEKTPHLSHIDRFAWKCRWVICGCMWRGITSSLLPTCKSLSCPRAFPSCEVQRREMGWRGSAQRGPWSSSAPLPDKREEFNAEEKEIRQRMAHTGIKLTALVFISTMLWSTEIIQGQQKKVCKQWSAPRHEQKWPLGCFSFGSAEHSQSSKPSNFGNCRGQWGWTAKNPFWLMNTLALLTPAPCVALTIFWSHSDSRSSDKSHQKFRSSKTKFWSLSVEKKALN